MWELKETVELVLKTLAICCHCWRIMEEKHTTAVWEKHVTSNCSTVGQGWSLIDEEFIRCTGFKHTRRCKRENHWCFDKKNWNPGRGFLRRAALFARITVFVNSNTARKVWIITIYVTTRAKCLIYQNLEADSSFQVLNIYFQGWTCRFGLQVLSGWHDTQFKTENQNRPRCSVNVQMSPNHSVLLMTCLDRNGEDAAAVV